MVVVTIYTTLKLVGRWPPKSIIYAGLTVFCIGLWLLYTKISLTVTPLSLLSALVVMGAGSGLFVSQIGMLTFSTVHREQIAEASSIYTPFQNLGSALGRAILGTVLIATASAKIVDQAIAEFGQTVTPAERDRAIATLERVIQTYTRQERREFFGQLPAAIQPSLDPILNTAAVEAMQVAVLLALGFSLICLLSAVFLPKRSLHRSSGL
jgi:hypothetical protein